MRGMLMILALASWSCQEVSSVATASEYYGVDSLISVQQKALYRHKATLEKKASIGKDSSSITFQPDSAQWLDELNIFKRLDITNPSLKGQYSSDTRNDPNSNLTIQTWHADAPGAEVKLIKLYYLEKVEELRKLEATWEDRNPLNRSKKNMTLLFEDIHNEVLLTGYEIEGVQKMVLQDTVVFRVIGKVKYQ